MTLVYGYASTDIGFLVGDTLVTYPARMGATASPTLVEDKYALKVHILDARTAVAFSTSNDVETSLRLIGRLGEELHSGGNLSTPEQLFELYREARNNVTPSPDCEFLVLQLMPDKKKLAYVSEDGVSYRLRAYIGDGNEHKCVMALRRPYESPKVQLVQQPDGTFKSLPLAESEGEVEFAVISDALERHAGNRRGKTPTVGGWIIRVCDARHSGELEYLQSGEASLSPWEGQSGYSLLASNSGTRGVGIYYRSGKTGFVFVAGGPQCQKERAETLQQFIKCGEAKYGMKLTGVTFGAQS